jgi:hypothetical protein
MAKDKQNFPLPDPSSTPSKTYAAVSRPAQGTGPGSAGQSGDTQALSDDAKASSESVLELVEEGQSLEAEIVDGVENAPDPETPDGRAKPLVIEERSQSRTSKRNRSI